MPSFPRRSASRTGVAVKHRRGLRIDPLREVFDPVPVVRAPGGVPEAAAPRDDERPVKDAVFDGADARRDRYLDAIAGLSREIERADGIALRSVHERPEEEQEILRTRGVLEADLEESRVVLPGGGEGEEDLSGEEREKLPCGHQAEGRGCRVVLRGDPGLAEQSKDGIHVDADPESPVGTLLDVEPCVPRMSGREGR